MRQGLTNDLRALEAVLRDSVPGVEKPELIQEAVSEINRCHGLLIKASVRDADYRLSIQGLMDMIPGDKKVGRKDPRVRAALAAMDAGNAAEIGESVIFIHRQIDELRVGISASTCDAAVNDKFHIPVQPIPFKAAVDHSIRARQLAGVPVDVEFWQR